MRTRTLRLGFLCYLALLTYLFQANILAVEGVANLPLAFGTIGGQWFGIQTTLLIMSMLGALVTYFVNERLRVEGREPTAETK